VGIAGVVTLGVAASVFYIAVAPGMVARLNLDATPRTLRVATVLWARVGYLARGAVYAIIGGLLVLSALHHHAAAAGTMAGALRTVRYEHHGSALLALIGIGFIANGTVELVRARHRTIALR
jgi:drug/metabolite transporter superfamily protein YnfA